MQNPDHEIRHVVRSLCQGTVEEQSRTLDRYFTRDASFAHPFCIVPHFDGFDVPLLGRLSSRDVVRAIFRWYRMMSPRIAIEIDSALHDKARDKMYLDIRQTFSIWFFPMYNAHVRLVTVLDLVATDDAHYHEPLDKLIEAASSEKQDGGTSSTTVHLGTTYVPSSGHASRRWKISKQEDLYQVNQFFRFTGPTPLSWLWFLFQLGASAVCVFLALFVRLSPWSMQKEPAKGGVEAVIELRHEDEGEKVEHTEHTEHTEHKEHMEYVEHTEHTELGDSSMGRAGSISEESSLGGDGSGSGAPTNGHRRLSANSKASPSQLPKKSWKNGKKR